MTDPFPKLYSEKSYNFSAIFVSPSPKHKPFIPVVSAVVTLERNGSSNPQPHCGFEDKWGFDCMNNSGLADNWGFQPSTAL